MFGLTFREMLTRLIIKTYKDNLQLYELLLKQKLENIDNILSAEEITLISEQAMHEFESMMFAKCSEHIKASSPSISTRFQLACSSPRICGVDEDSENILSSPAVLFYAMAFWSYYNKDYSLKNNDNYNDAYKIVASIRKMIAPAQQEFAHAISIKLLSNLKDDTTQKF